MLGVQVGPQLGHRQELLVTGNTWGCIGPAVEHKRGVCGGEVGGEGVGREHRRTKMTF